MTDKPGTTHGMPDAMLRMYGDEFCTPDNNAVHQQILAHEQYQVMQITLLQQENL
jgi:hypothetical protein